MENTQSVSKSPKLKLDFKDSKYATGRRKTSIAKVWLKKGSGKIYVCLLYTSPSPRDKRQSRMPSSA